MANFGADGPVASYADIDQAELICLYGHNVAEVQTVLWERMLAAKAQQRAASSSPIRGRRRPFARAPTCICSSAAAPTSR